MKTAKSPSAYWQRGLLVLALVATWTALGRVVFSWIQETPETATAGDEEVAWQFPPSVPLDQWRSLPTDPILPRDLTLVNGEDRELSFETQQDYYYGQGDRQVRISMRYAQGPEPNQTNFRFYGNYAAQNPQVQIRTATNPHGDYLVAIAPQGVSVHACISPRSPSAVTYGNFMQHRYSYDLQPQRVLAWSLGFGVLRDQRCLWSSLFLPTATQPTPEDIQTLETLWAQWKPWWQSHFPPGP